MKEEFEDEFIEEVEEFEGEMEDVVELSEEEMEEVTGGAFAGSSNAKVKNMGSYSVSTRNSSVNLPKVLTKVGVVDSVQWMSRNGANYAFGAGRFVVTRGSKLGAVKLKIYGHIIGTPARTRYITYTVNFK